MPRNLPHDVLLIYHVWLTMRRRCSQPKCKDFPLYGGRGIQVCNKWKDDFEAFAKDMGPRPPNTTLDRINNDGNYEPGNCRWADHVTQACNRRRKHDLPTGVSVWPNGKYRAYIHKRIGSRRKMIHLGTFERLQDAVSVVNRARAERTALAKALGNPGKEGE